MKASAPPGLTERLSTQMKLASLLPGAVLDGSVSALSRLGLLPADLRAGTGAFLAPGVKETNAPFTKMMAKWLLDARRAARDGKKVFLVPFNFPVELLHAFDRAYPLTSEMLTTLGVVSLPGQGESYWDLAMGMGLPDHICSASAVELGSLLGCRDFRPQGIISSAAGACDVNAKMHELVANHLSIPHFFLQKPPDDSGRGRQQYAAYLRQMIAELESFLGEKLDQGRLRSVLERANRCTELYHELYDLQRAVPSPVPNLFSIMISGTRFTMWGTDEAVQVLEKMVQVSKQRLASPEYADKKEVARCFWSYTSYYFDLAGLFNWMDEQGYSHLGDILGLCFPQPIDTAGMDSMLEGLAETAWNMPMTRQVGAESLSGSWTEDVLWASQQLKADCVIYCGHHSCKQTWSVVSILRKELMNRANLPMLTLQGDAWIKRMTPISAIQQEIDEFVKNAVVKRKLPGGRKLRRRRKGAAVDAEGQGPGSGSA